MFKKKGNTYKTMLKERIKDEIISNNVFSKGRNRALILMGIYTSIYFLDVIISPIISDTPFMIDADLVISLFVAVMGFVLALRGNVIIAGILSLLAVISNGLMMFLASKINWESFAQMLQFSPLAQFMFIATVMNVLIAIWMFTDKNITAYGKRRKELEDELGYELYLSAKQLNLNENEMDLTADSFKEVTSEAPTAEGDHPQEEPPAVESEQPKEEIVAENEQLREEMHLKQEEQNRLEEEQAMLEQLKETRSQGNIAELMCEFQGEESTLRAFSQVNVLCKVSKKRFFDVDRELLCKKFSCSETEINPTTYVITFPNGGKMLMRWLKEDKCLYIESNTKNYDVQFHKLMLDAVAYLGKNMGFKLRTTDLSGYADSRDENKLKSYFDESV